MGPMSVPPVRYARSDGVSLAYQVYGTGPTVVTVPPAAQNIELAWESPRFRVLLERMGSFCRHVHFDKRGTGVSDRTVGVPTMDQRVEDLLTVMDDAGVGSAYLVGVSEGGPMALQFAATYPERVDGVVVLTSGARIFGDMTTEESEMRRVRAEHLLDVWGTDASVSVDVWAPSLAGDAAYRAWHVRYERPCASPAAIRELYAMLRDIDVRPLLPFVDAPTLVIHRRHDPVLPLALAEEVVAGVRDARLVVVEGRDHFTHAGDMHAWLDEIEAFVTGGVATRPANSARRSSGRTSVLSTMGGFAAAVDGVEVLRGAWGRGGPASSASAWPSRDTSPSCATSSSSCSGPMNPTSPGWGRASRCCSPTSVECSVAASSPTVPRFASTRRSCARTSRSSTAPCGKATTPPRLPAITGQCCPRTPTTTGPRSPAIASP